MKIDTLEISKQFAIRREIILSRIKNGYCDNAPLLEIDLLINQFAWHFFGIKSNREKFIAHCKSQL